MYLKQCMEWCEEGIPLDVAPMYLLYYCHLKYNLEIDEGLTSKYAYLLEECENMHKSNKN